MAATPDPLWYEYSLDDREVQVEDDVTNPAHDQWILERIRSDTSIPDDILSDPYTVLFDNRGLPFQTATSFDDLPEDLCTRGKKRTDS
mgnify:FL=1